MSEIVRARKEKMERDRMAAVDAQLSEADLALCHASAYGDSEAMEAALASGANPNCISARGRPLLLAIRNGDPQGVGILLDAGADPNAEKCMGEYPDITYAARLPAVRRNGLEIVRLLIQAGANVNGNGGAFPPMRVASESAKIMKLLLGAGANVFPSEGMPDHNESYCQPLEAALQGARWASLKVILGALPAERIRQGAGRHAMHSAISRGGEKAVRILLDAGMSPLGRPEDERSPIGWAIDCGRREICLLLVKRCEPEAHLANVIKAIKEKPLEDWAISDVLPRLEAVMTAGVLRADLPDLPRGQELAEPAKRKLRI